MFKVIIFDFDGTLHNGEKWENWQEYMKKTIEFATQDLTEYQRKKFMQRQNITYLSNTSDVANAFINEFGTAQKMIDFQTQNIYRLDYQNMKFVEPQFLEKLEQKYHLYIVSNTPVQAIKRHFSHWGISPAIFKKIYFNQFLAEDPSKAAFYKIIKDKEKVTTDQILVIGDNLKDDLIPAQNENMHTLYVKSLSDIYSFFDNLERE